jgi:hypothetical protein
MCNNDFRLLVCMAITMSVLISTGFSAETNEPNDPNEILQQRLDKIIGGNKGEISGLDKLETDCLALLDDYKSPAQKGKIYAQIAVTYSQHRFTLKNNGGIPIAKSIEYSKKALDLPLDVITSCEMYGTLASSMVAESSKSEDQFVELRREAIVFCLKGLKLALDNNAPDVFPSVPAVGIYHISPKSPNYERMMKKHQEEVNARKKWEFEYQLYMQRQDLVGLCRAMYLHKPYNLNEFQQFSQTILKDHTKVSDDIASEIQRTSSQLK